MRSVRGHRRRRSPRLPIGQHQERCGFASLGGRGYARRPDLTLLACCPGSPTCSFVNGNRGQVFFDHPTVVRSPTPGSPRVELAVTLNRYRRQPIESRTSEPKVFEHPSQALAGCHVQSEGIIADPLDTESRSCQLESVNDLGKAAAVLRHAESIDQRALEIGDRHPGISDPRLHRAEEAGRPHLDEPVDHVVDEAAVARLFRAASPQTRDGCLMSRKHEGRPWHLRREAVVVQRRPVRDGSGIDQCHGDLELVHLRHTRYG